MKRLAAPPFLLFAACAAACASKNTGPGEAEAGVSSEDASPSAPDASTGRDGTPADRSGTSDRRPVDSAAAPDRASDARVASDTRAVDAARPTEVGSVDGPPVVTTGRSFPATSPWVAYYNDAEHMGDLAAVASKFRILDIDVDPGLGNFSKEQVATLKNNGRNRVLSYFNLGACENFRKYWNTVPSGFLSCSANKAAQLGVYQGWANEEWMNLGNADYQHLIVDYVAPNLVSLGIDGFYFDNLDIVDHGTNTSNGPCDAACVQGAFDVVRKLRENYPALLFVMQNAVGVTAQKGITGGVPFPQLLDGVVGENTFTPLPNGDSSLLADLKTWQKLALPDGRAYWIGTVEYLDCTDTTNITGVVQKGSSNGFVTYVAPDGLGSICGYWLQ